MYRVRSISRVAARSARGFATVVNAARTVAPALSSGTRFATAQQQQRRVGGQLQVRALSDFKDDYDGKVADRAAQGLVMTPLNPQETAALVEHLKAPPAGEEDFLMDLFTNRVPPGVDESAYVKAAFLADVAKGAASSPIIDRVKAVEILGQ
eukprot:gene14086-24065_t